MSVVSVLPKGFESISGAENSKQNFLFQGMKGKQKKIYEFMNEGKCQNGVTLKT